MLDYALCARPLEGLSLFGAAQASAGGRAAAGGGRSTARVARADRAVHGRRRSAAGHGTRTQYVLSTPWLFVFWLCGFQRTENFETFRVLNLVFAFAMLKYAHYDSLHLVVNQGRFG